MKVGFVKIIVVLVQVRDIEWFRYGKKPKNCTEGGGQASIERFNEGYK